MKLAASPFATAGALLGLAAASATPAASPAAGKFVVKLEVAENIYRVTNPNGGARLSHAPESGLKLIEVQEGGATYAFKDLNRNGKLDPFEDWRLDAQVRAADLAARLSIEQISGLMLYPVGEPGEKGAITEDVLARMRDLHVRFMLSNRSTKAQVVPWNNGMQRYLEANDPNGIPMNLSSDPRNTTSGGATVVYDDSNMSGWPGNLGLAATFDPEQVLLHAQITSQEYRAFGIHTALSPQVDLATEPRWSRFSGTFGEGSKLAGEMAAAYVKGFQGTWEGLGSRAKDLGWGNGSVVTMIKHFPGDGAAEGGREAHNNFGKFNVYPGDNLAEHYGVFKAAFETGAKTGSPKAIMPSYSIAIGNHGPIGRPVASGYSKYKLTTLLREQLGYDGLICSDWDITSNKTWGVENLTTLQRQLYAMQSGLNMFGGSNDMAANRDAYEMGVKALGNYTTILPGMPEPFLKMLQANVVNVDPKGTMEKLYRDSATKVLAISFYTGLFDDPYLVASETQATLANQKFKQAGLDAQKASVVMLKNHGQVIRPWQAGKLRTVYVPMRFNPAMEGWGGQVRAATVARDFAGAPALDSYFNVVTDTLRAGADPTHLQASDIIRRTDFKGVDLALLSASSPKTGSGFDQGRVNLDKAKGPIDNGYYPISLQYGEYYADPAVVRPYPMGLDPDEELQWIAAGGEAGRSRYYGGKRVTASNLADLEYIRGTRQRIGAIPLVVFLNVDRPMVFSEFEGQVDGLLVGFSISDGAAVDVLAGKYQPHGLLPMQMPADMKTVEQQKEDVPFDMAVHVDAEGHAYDYAYGMDWAGVIHDHRTDRYGHR